MYCMQLFNYFDVYNYYCLNMCVWCWNPPKVVSMYYIW